MERRKGWQREREEKVDKRERGRRERGEGSTMERRREKVREEGKEGKKAGWGGCADGKKMRVRKKRGWRIEECTCQK